MQGDKPPGPKKVSYVSLFSYATRTDVALTITGVILALGNGAILPAFAVLFGDLVNALNDPDPNALLDEVETVAIWFLIIGVATFVASVGEVSFPQISANKQIKRIRVKYMWSLLRQDIAWHDSHLPGEIAGRLAEQTIVLHNGIGSKLGNVLHHSGTFLGGIIVGLVLSWKLSLIILAFIPALALSAASLKIVQEKFDRLMQESYAKANEIAAETLSNIRTVMAFGREPAAVLRYQQHLGNAERTGVKKMVGTGLSVGCTYFFMYVAHGVALWYGADLILKDRDEKPLLCDPSINPNAFTNEDDCMLGGTVLQVFFSVLIGSFALGQAAPNFAAFGAAQAAAANVFNTIDSRPTIDPWSDEGRKVPVESMRGTIELRNVTFTYPSRPNECILKNLSLKFEAGSTVALVGTSGSGKSTIMQLIQRFYDPDEGQVLLDGEDIRSFNVADYRQKLGIVSQEPQLFATSIRENIAFGKGADGNPTEEEVITAAKDANAHEFVVALKSEGSDSGYDVHVGDRGSQLSGGQKQRIAIARALVRDPQILLLDEATSALDSRSEKIVQSALDKILTNGKQRTTIVIAHRLSTIKNASKIVVLDHGQTVEQGTHEELMKLKDGQYRKLYLMSLRQEVVSEKGNANADKADDEEYDQNDDENILADISLKESSFSEETKPEPRAEPSNSLGSKQDAEEKVLNQAADVNEDTKNYPPVPFKRIWAYQRQDWGLLVSGSFAAVINGAIMPAFGLVFSEIIILFFQIDNTELRNDALFWMGMFFVLAVVSMLAYTFQNYAFGVMGERLTRRMREEVFANLMRMEVGFFDLKKHSTGRLTSRLASDAALVKAATGEKIGLSLQNMVSLVVGLIIAFVSSWQLTLVILGTIPIMGFAATLETRFFTGTGEQDSKDNSYEEAGRVALEAITGVRTVAALNLQSRILNLFSDTMAKSDARTKRKAWLAGTGFAASQTLQFWIYALCFYVGGLFIYDGILTFDDLFKTFFVLTMAAYGAGQAASMATDRSKAEPAKRSIFALLDRNTLIDAYDGSGKVCQNLNGKVEFKNVCFSYPARPDVPTLQNFNFTCEKGQTVAFVGASGSGKSTCMQLLERFYDPTSGCILVDGIDIKDMNLASYRGNLSIVSQEPSLFGESIAYNIAYGRNTHGERANAEKVGGLLDATHGTPDADVELAAKSSNAHGFITEFPGSYGTFAGVGGNQLSGGQKQRCAIARAIIRNPNILLLDEATSALDNESERVVQAALDDLLQDGQSRTTFIVAHRLSTIRNADVICVLEKGQMVEYGSHAELMNSSIGAYRKLVEAAEGRSSTA